MPAYSDERTQFYKEKVRQALVFNPRASHREIREMLEKNPKNPITLAPDYIGKLVHKIRTERDRRQDFEHVGRRLSEIQDKTTLVTEQMWRILLSPTTEDKDKVAAGKVIIEGEHRLLEAQMDAGVFKRKLGTVDVEHQHEHTVTLKLPDEIKLPILRAFANYGIIRNTKYKLPAPPASS